MNIMNKESERYRTKVEIPISAIIETIFSSDNHDVETLCRWAKKYGFVDLIKENENDKLGYYKLQDDYDKQSFYILLDKEERKQYDYENYLLDEIDKKDKEIKKLNSVIDKLENWLNNELDRIEKMINPKTGIKPYGEELICLRIIKNSYIYTKDKLKELKGSDE